MSKLVSLDQLDRRTSCLVWWCTLVVSMFITRHQWVGAGFTVHHHPLYLSVTKHFSIRHFSLVVLWLCWADDDISCQTVCVSVGGIWLCCSGSQGSSNDAYLSVMRLLHYLHRRYTYYPIVHMGCNAQYFKPLTPVEITTILSNGTLTTKN